MSDEHKTFQPKWDERKNSHRHHHHDYYRKSSNYTNSWGGWMKQKDKQAYYGLMFVVIAILAFGAYKLVKMVVDEVREMPMDDPTQEMNVDELRVRKVEEQDALLFSDSLAQVQHLDSIRKNVQIETRPVYRPPKKEDKWYITQREWKAIRKNYEVWKWDRKRAKEQRKLERERKKQEQREKKQQEQQQEQQ